MNATTKGQRIHGLDAARGLAVIGMVLVNFMIVFSTDIVHELTVNPASFDALPASSALSAILVFYGFAGRAVSIFLVLFGVGIALQARRARPGFRRALVKRYLLLVLVGALLLPIWPADILHFIGVFGLLSLLVTKWSSHKLLALSVVLLVAAELLRMAFDYTQGWAPDAVGYDYVDMWSASGQLRQLFFNGFHPVFPWWSYVTFGMVLGRLNLQEARVLKRLVWASLSAFAVSIVLQALGVPHEFFPAHTLFVLSGMSSATAVIALCCYWATGTRAARLRGWIESTGRLAFTQYPTHVLFGIVPVMALRGEVADMRFDHALLLSLLYLALTMSLGHWWLRRHAQGPLEAAIRKLSVNRPPRATSGTAKEYSPSAP